MHAVKIPFSGIENLSVCPKKTFFLQKPFFLKIEPFKKTFFFTKSSLQPVIRVHASIVEVQVLFYSNSQKRRRGVTRRVICGKQCYQHPQEAVVQATP